MTGKPYYSEGGIEIYHGDCRDILPSLPRADLLLSDPPYGIGYVHGAALGHMASRFNETPVVGDDAPFDPTWLLPLADGVILWGANHYADKLPPSRGWLIWDKRCNTVVNDQSDAELAWTNLLGTARIHYLVWDGFRRGGGEKNIPRVHPTQKPVQLMGWCLQFARDAKSVVDPYMGSGTTLVAAQRNGLKAIGIEVEERYCEIAAKRIEQVPMFSHLATEFVA